MLEAFVYISRQIQGHLSNSKGFLLPSAPSLKILHMSELRFACLDTIARVIFDRIKPFFFSNKVYFDLFETLPLFSTSGDVR